MKKREDYLRWDEYFMAIAKLSSMRSKDPHTQVGACIVSEDNKILSTGYNGTPTGVNDDDMPWGNQGGVMDTKYAYICHSELNAILNYSGNTDKFKKSRIYVCLFPCNECAKAIIQVGIKDVIYLNDKYGDTEETKIAKYLFEKAGVKCRPFQDEYRKELTIDIRD